MKPDPYDRGAATSAVLDAQARLFGELAELARGQRRALLAGDQGALEEMSLRAETLATRFRLLEDERSRQEQEQPQPQGRLVERAREGARRALAALLEEVAISATVLERWGDTVMARQAAVWGLFGAAYLPNGRPSGAPAGVRLRVEG